MHSKYLGAHAPLFFARIAIKTFLVSFGWRSREVVLDIKDLFDLIA